MSLEVGPSLPTIDTAFFNASVLTLVVEMILFVFANIRFTCSIIISISKNETAVREAAALVVRIGKPPILSA